MDALNTIVALPLNYPNDNIPGISDSDDEQQDESDACPVHRQGELEQHAYARNKEQHVGRER